MKLSSTALGLSIVLGLAGAPAIAKSAAEWQALTATTAVGITQAMEKAQTVAPGKVIEAELEAGKKGATPYYSVTLVSPANEEIKLRVNAATGDAAIEKNKGKAERKHTKYLAEAQITLAQAVDAAVAHTPGKPVEAQLDSDWGKTSYKVKLLQADNVVTSVRLDAETGKVTGTKKD